MSYMIDLPTYDDKRGVLTVVENILPFDIKRFYYIYDVNSKRGGHRHIKTIQALICIGGSCEVYINDSIVKKTILLNRPNKCLVLDPKDWHTMDNFSKGSTLLVFASHYYDKDDYIYEEY
jgi:hypothetical protein